MKNRTRPFLSYQDSLVYVNHSKTQVAISYSCLFSLYSKDVNFSAFIAAIAKVNTTGFDRDTTYAFFMNVYNALAIKMIIDHPCSRWGGREERGEREEEEGEGEKEAKGGGRGF